MAFLRFAFRVGGKNLFRNFSLNSSQVVMESEGKDSNQSLAFPCSVYGNNLSLNASDVMPLCLKLSHIWLKERRWDKGSSLDIPPKRPLLLIIWNITGLNSKLSALIVALTIGGFVPSKPLFPLLFTLSPISSWIRSLLNPLKVLSISQSSANSGGLNLRPARVKYPQDV